MSDNKKKHNETDLKYAHNPRYCMILPDAEDEWEEDIVSTGQSEAEKPLAREVFCKVLSKQRTA